ncbi:Protein zer-1 [Orchesella cincta]|uniref:Protein zer-1 n=1 Tax=Orchesella cincta TaxID=48709 RepID=A0A1D2N9Y6_ORCCI|nr:Protein zer-1 [Orchesella cincta]
MHCSPSKGTLSLKNLCLQSIAKEVTATAASSSALHNADLWLPVGLSQENFDLCMSGAVEEVNNVIGHFLKNPQQTPLDKICFQNLRGVNVDLLFRIVKANLHTLTHLDIRGCHTLPKKFWNIVNDAPKLQSLKTTKLEVPLRCLNLKTLVVDWAPRNIMQKIQQRIHPMYFNEMLKHVLPNLKHLDLSWCPWVNRLTTLGSAKNLEILILRNCNITSIVQELSQLDELRGLDISVGVELRNNRSFNGTYVNPTELFDTLINSLVKLESLNISGTNLDGCTSTNLPSCKVIGSSGYVVPTEVIKRNYNMPKTMYMHLRNLEANSLDDSFIDANELLQIQIRILGNLRHNDNYRDWALKSTLKLLEHLDKPQVSFDIELRSKLWLLVNRALYSQFVSKYLPIPESILSVVFQIYLKLLPVDEPVKDEGTRKEILRLGKYLQTLRTSSFVYLKTEALYFRLLHRISVEPSVCENFSRNGAVKSCIEFFKSLQLYLGYSLSASQASQIVQAVWKSIWHLMNASPVGTQHFLKYHGLNWIQAHLSWFKNDQRTKTELCNVYQDILKLLKQDADISGGKKTCHSDWKVLMNKIEYQINVKQ